MKKAESPRTSVRTIIYEYACKDACVKVANVMSVKKCSQGGGGGGHSGPDTCVLILILIDSFIGNPTG